MPYRLNPRRLLADRSGNFGIMSALLIPILLAAAGGAVDVSSAFLQKADMQGSLDAAVLAAARKPDLNSQTAEAMSFLGLTKDDLAENGDVATTGKAGFSFIANSDGSVTGNYSRSMPTHFLSLVGLPQLPVKVQSTAIAGSTPASLGNGCIYVLGNASQAVLINSGASVKSVRCTVQVQSTSNPAFIMNSGATINTAQFCVRGTNYIKNGGTLSNLAVGCNAAPDPFAGLLPEPTVPGKCTTSGTMDGQTITLSPGKHCATTFNGSPTITFQPGLHIISGRMIINSGATVTAKGVTFYYPDVNSEIRVNGGLTFTAEAPTSGPYKGLLMFEKTSDAGNNGNKQQYIFNGSKGESLSGVIYLPNRDVTYNSTTTQTSNIALVANTMIMNSSNWLIEPYVATTPAGLASVATTPRLIK